MKKEYKFRLLHLLHSENRTAIDKKCSKQNIFRLLHAYYMLLQNLMKFKKMIINIRYIISYSDVTCST